MKMKYSSILYKFLWRCKQFIFNKLLCN